MKLGRWVFAGAGVYGLLLAIPFSFQAIVSSEGVLPNGSGAGMFLLASILQHIVWQIGYLIISRDPVRYRLFMIPAILSMTIGALGSVWVYAYGITIGIPLAFINVLFALLFIFVYWRLGWRVQAGAA